MTVRKRTTLRWVLVFSLLVATAGSAPAWATDGVGIRWYDYEEGRSLMQSEGKKGFLNFWAEWCSYCKMMEKETFSNKAVVAYLNRNFVAMKVNSDKNTKKAAEYGVRGLPSTWFLSDKGERIGNRPGYITPKEMLNLLKYVNTGSYEKMSLDDFVTRKEK